MSAQIEKLSPHARRLLRYALSNSDFIPLAEARNKNAASMELQDEMLIVPVERESMSGFQLTEMGVKAAKQVDSQ